MKEAAASPSHVSLDDLDVVARGLVRDLHTARPAVFWADLLVSGAVGWGAFAVAVLSAPWSLQMFVSVAIAALALYRCLCFTHEITHFRRGSVPGFETAWNAIVGVPLLLPTFAYVGVHQSHHSLSTYGTKDDPEYLPFARSRVLIVTFALQSSFLLPVLLGLRFLVLSPIGLVWPRFHRWLEVYASSFSMNPAYRRVVSADMARRMRHWELAIVVAWGAFIAATAAGYVPVRVFFVWLGMFMVICFMNTLRVLGAHEYDTDGKVVDRHGQLIDSIDTPGAIWTELWAPVGLRYHALHHYFPGIPYHNLGIAYRRIVNAAGAERYRDFSSPSLRHSLVSLYNRAGLSEARQDDRLQGDVPLRSPGR